MILNAYYVGFWGILLLGIGCIYYNTDEVKKNIFIVSVSAYLLFLFVFRDYSVGADTWNYANNYKELQTMSYYSWEEIISRLWRGIFGSTEYLQRDAGYYLLTKIFASIFSDFRVYLFLIGLLMVISVGIFVKKFSDDYCLSYLLFYSFYFSFFCSALRQMLAILLVGFLGIWLIRKRRMWCFIVLVLFATTIHTTAVVMLPLYFLYHVKINEVYKYICCIGFILLPFAVKILAMIMSYMGIYSVYLQPQLQQPANHLYLFIAIVLWTFWRYPNGNEDREFNLGMHMSVATVYLLGISAYYSTFTRLALYYMTGSIFFLPRVKCTMDAKMRKTYTLLLVLMLFYMVYRTGFSYKFMW